ncbi:MAG: ice-binding family protein [Pseudolysinimonas sp.]
MGIAAAIVGLGVVGLTGGSASADTTINGPIDLGNATSFGVLAGSAITNTGTSTVSGDAGVSPLTSIGLLAGDLTGGGALHPGDSVATSAQTDTATAFGVAASLTPTSSGFTELGGQSLGPGVYSGGALSVNGVLTLVGTADSVWVFQAASTLITGSNSSVVLSGVGVTSCNVFWEVGSSATLGTGSTMVGTVMALASISTDGGNTVNGRLLARTAAVTLINTTVNRPSGCSTPIGSVSSSPTITSTVIPSGTVGTPFSFTLTASGSADSDFVVMSGGLAPGLSLESTTGVISGTPTIAGTFPMTISADNGIAPAGTADFRFAVLDTLALTGTDIHPALEAGGITVATGIAMLVLSRRRQPTHRV